MLILDQSQRGWDQCQLFLFRSCLLVCMQQQESLKNIRFKYTGALGPNLFKYRMKNMLWSYALSDRSLCHTLKKTKSKKLLTKDVFKIIS